MRFSRYYSLSPRVLRTIGSSTLASPTRKPQYFYAEVFLFSRAPCLNARSGVRLSPRPPSNKLRYIDIEAFLRFSKYYSLSPRVLRTIGSSTISSPTRKPQYFYAEVFLFSRAPCLNARSGVRLSPRPQENLSIFMLRFFYFLAPRVLTHDREFDSLLAHKKNL